jgi:hypothetical protein
VASCPPLDCGTCDERQSAAAAAFAEISKKHPKLSPSGFPKFIADAYAKHPALARDFEIDCTEVPCLAILDDLPFDDQMEEGAMLNALAKELGPDGDVYYLRSNGTLVVGFKAGQWTPEEGEALEARTAKIADDRNSTDDGG